MEVPQVSRAWGIFKRVQQTVLQTFSFFLPKSPVPALTEKVLGLSLCLLVHRSLKGGRAGNRATWALAASLGEDCGTGVPMQTNTMTTPRGSEGRRFHTQVQVREAAKGRHSPGLQNKKKKKKTRLIFNKRCYFCIAQEPHKSCWTFCDCRTYV